MFHHAFVAQQLCRRYELMISDGYKHRDFPPMKDFRHSIGMKPQGNELLDAMMIRDATPNIVDITIGDIKKMENDDG